MQVSTIGPRSPLQWSLHTHTPILLCSHSLIHSIPAHLALLLVLQHSQHIPMPVPEPSGVPWPGIPYPRSSHVTQASAQMYPPLRGLFWSPSRSPSHYPVVVSFWCLQQSEKSHFFINCWPLMPARYKGYELYEGRDLNCLIHPHIPPVPGLRWALSKHL